MLIPLTTPEAVRTTFGRVPSGVVAIAAAVDGSDEVLVASSFTPGVSLEPPLVSFAVRNASTTWPRVRSAASFGVSLLAGDQGQLCRQLSSRDQLVRWSGVQAHRTGDGALLIPGAALWMTCSLAHEYPAGDHSIAVLRVHDSVDHGDVDPLLFHGSRFRALAALS